MPLTIWNFVLSKMTTGGNRAVSWPPVIATRFVSFATTLNFCNIEMRGTELATAGLVI